MEEGKKLGVNERKEKEEREDYWKVMMKKGNE